MVSKEHLWDYLQMDQKGSKKGVKQVKKGVKVSI